jgi:clathrin interactor 1
VTSPPAFKADDKRPISVKAPVKLSTAAMGASSTASKQPSKRIDLGAASNYGKTTELGINSPTHRNTHSEDLFGSEISSSSSAAKSKHDIFDADDFDPRAGEAAATGDFGDFESAFGGATVVSAKIPLPSSSSSSQSAGTNFADFSSAFSSTSKPVQPLDDNFLFASQPNSTAIATTGNDLSADLFGNNVITSTFTSQTSAATSSGRNDLLDDFADLKINTGNQGE